MSGWEEDGRDARGFDHPPLFPSASLSFDYSSFSPCPSSPGLSLGRSLSPRIFGDHLPCRVPSTFMGMGLTPGSVSWDGCLQGGSESIHPFPVRGPGQRPLCLGVMVCVPPPPFPSSFGSNLGVRAPSLYKPWGGGSPGMVVAASGWEGEVYFVYE